MFHETLFPTLGLFSTALSLSFWFKLSPGDPNEGGRGSGGEHNPHTLTPRAEPGKVLPGPFFPLPFVCYTDAVEAHFAVYYPSLSVETDISPSSLRLLLSFFSSLVPFSEVLPLPRVEVFGVAGRGDGRKTRSHYVALVIPELTM